MKKSTVIKWLPFTVILFFMPFTSLFAQQIGLQLYSLRNEFKTDIPGTLAKIKEWKIKQIEGGGTYGLPVDAYKKLLQQNNLQMVSYGASFEELQNNLPAVTDNAKTFGSKFIMCSWIPHKEGEFTREDLIKAVAIFNTAGKLLKEKGLQFCYHPHGYEFRPFENGTMFD
jgi:sugar phosphate isomerase/epimerase